jgi:hypothetical protein
MHPTILRRRRHPVGARAIEPCDRRRMQPARGVSTRPRLLSLLLVAGFGCSHAQRVQVPVDDANRSCVAACGDDSYACLRACPDARESDGACTGESDVACAQHAVTSGRDLAVGGVAALVFVGAIVGWLYVEAPTTH